MLYLGSCRHTMILLRSWEHSQCAYTGFRAVLLQMNPNPKPNLMDHFISRI